MKKSIDITKNWQENWLSWKPAVDSNINQEFMHVMNSNWWPMTLAYPIDFPQTFICGIDSIESLNQFGSGLARDGLIPLMWFFQKFKKPAAYRGRIYLAKGLQDYVPTAWRKNIGTFEIRRLPTKTRYSNLLLCATHSDRPISQEQLLVQISKARKLARKLGINLNKTEALIFRNSHHNQNSEVEFSKFHLLLFKYFKENIKFNDFHKLRERITSSQSLVINLDDSLICKDHYLTNYMIARGGSSLECELAPRLKTGDHEIPLSLTHSVYLNESPNFKNLNAGFLKHISQYQLKSVKTKPVDRLNPWPQWFENAVRSLGTGR